MVEQHVGADFSVGSQNPILIVHIPMRSSVTASLRSVFVSLP